MSSCLKLNTHKTLKKFELSKVWVTVIPKNNLLFLGIFFYLSIIKNSANKILEDFDLMLKPHRKI
jgi:hypothetical protein